MWRRTIMLSAVAAILGSSAAVRMQAAAEEPPWQAFLAAASTDPKQAQAALAEIAGRWRDSYAAMIVDVVRFLPSPRPNLTADEGIVYCTLCGTVIPYESGVGGRRFTFGTSGLLYRSNKLMFDEETRSLWSSLEGVPVVGTLVDSGLQLPFRSVVTTTWGEWRQAHPATTVLSLETGYERNYGEGVAYRDYFATDRLMFEVPHVDTRLRNKAEVLALRPETIGTNALPVAIAVERLRREPVYAFEAGGRNFVVITSKAGANMLFERSAHGFVPRTQDGELRDTTGKRWSVSADGLVSETGERLSRIPAHRAFWFGWVAQYPQTVLHK